MAVFIKKLNAYGDYIIYEINALSGLSHGLKKAIRDAW